MWTNASLDDTNVYVAGYSGDKPQTLWCSNGKITSSLSARLAHNCDTVGGVSGSAILNYSNQALAINTSGNSSANYGTRITERITTFLFNYIDI